MEGGTRGKATYGGKTQSKVKCPSCGHEVVVADRRFVDRGPIRCGACGAEVQRSMLVKHIEQAIRGEGTSG